MQKDNIDNREHWWLQNCDIIHLEIYYYGFYNNYFSNSVWCAHVLTIKQVFINYIHVITELEKEFPLDYLEVRTVAVLGANGARAKNLLGGPCFKVFIKQMIL